MKKIIILVCGLICATMAQAQSYLQALKAYNAAFVYKPTPDTTVNTDTTYLVSGLIDPYYDLSFVAINTKVSGTPAGSIIIQGSMDNFVSSVQTLTTNKAEAIFTTDTVTAVNGTTKIEYHFPNHQLSYYRIRYISSGTQTSVMTGTLWARKHSTAQY